MNIITGDETGLLKVINTVNGEIFTHGDQSRGSAIKGLDWMSQENSFALVRESGVLELWKYQESAYLLHCAHNLDISSPVSMTTLKVSSGQDSFVSFNETGNVSVNRFNNDLTLFSSKFNINGPLSACATCLNGGAIFGGKECDIQFYDVNTKQEVWKAKNVPHDKLSLRVPVWITALSFLHPESDSTSGAHVVSGTGYKQIRLYDTKASRQPVASIDIGDQFRVTAVLPSRDGQSLFVGDTAGGLYRWDLRTQRRVNTLQGSTGSIRHISMNKSGSYVASVGLDRYLRLYDSKCKVASSTYMKNRLNRCLVSEGRCGDSKSGAGAQDSVKKMKKGSGVRVENDRDEDVLEQYTDSSAEELEGEDSDPQSGDSESSDDSGSEDGEEQQSSGDEESSDLEVDFGGSGGSSDEDGPQKKGSGNSKKNSKSSNSSNTKRVWKSSKPSGNKAKQPRR